MESGEFWNASYMMMIKGSEGRPFNLNFRLNIALHYSYQAEEIVMGIEEWKKKLLDDYVKSE